MALKTKDYSKFRNITGNRGISPAHVRKLAAAIEKRNLLRYYPVLVNEKMEVIDGQHRLAAAAQLDYDIYYEKIKGLRIADVMELNTHSKSWNLRDFVEAYIQLDHKEYQELLDFAHDYNLSLSISAALMYGSPSLRGGSATIAVREGSFHIRNRERSIRLAKALNELRPYADFRIKQDREFISALNTLMNNDEFDTERLVAKLRVHHLKITPKKTARYYVLELDDIYNHSAKPEARIDLFAEAQLAGV